MWGLGVFPRQAAEAALGVHEVVLHVDDDECRPLDLRTYVCF